MESDYDYYLVGCREKGITPLSPWRFRIAYAWMLRESVKPFADLLALRPKLRSRVVARIGRYTALVEAVTLGYATVRPSFPSEGEQPQPTRDSSRLSPSAPILPTDEDEAGMADAGDRVLLPPPAPTLTGAAARPLPAPDDPDRSFWRV